MCQRVPVRSCPCWNLSVSFVIHWERSDQPQAFLTQKPHGVRMERLLQAGDCDRQERLAQES